MKAGPTNITVGFSTTNKLISRFIRWVTRSPCSHAWVAFDTPTFGRVVMQAESWGYEIRPWELWQQQNVLKAEFDVEGPSLSEAVSKFGTEFLGRPYDYKAALFAGVFRWLGRWVRGRLRSPYALMCSEATIRILQDAAYSSVMHFDPEVTSPKRLLVRVLEMALSYKSQFRVRFLHEDVKKIALKLV